MASEKIPLSYKGHPLRRKDNLIYYGTMAEKYIIMLQILDTKKVDDLDVATKVAVQLQLTDPDLKSRDRVVKKDREGQLIHRNGRGHGLAGPGTEHEVKSRPRSRNRDMTIRRTSAMHFSQSFAAKLTAGLLAVTGMIAPAFAVSGTVDAEGGLRLRNASSTDAAVLETIPDGSQIEVSGITESGWYQVSFQDTQGYVSTDYVVLSETVELPTVAEPVYGKVTEGPLNVRSAPQHRQ